MSGSQRFEAEYADNRWEIGYTDNLWELDYTNNPATTVEDKKKQYAFQAWREEFKNTENRIESKKNDMRDGWTEIYQLIGFFSVFQGVLFQGVTQLTAELSCKFYKIPITLSVLASVATCVGAHVKLAKVREYQKSVFRDKLRSKVLQSRISACKREGLKLQNFKEIEVKAKSAVDNLTTDYEGQLCGAHRVRVIVLALLTTFSGLFAWLINSIMCDN